MKQYICERCGHALHKVGQQWQCEACKATKEKVDNDKKIKEKELSDPEEQYNLGNSYYDKKDYEKAVYWYTKAAEQGFVNAQNNLGVCYGHG